MSEKVYQDIPEEDRRKAQVFFDRGKTVADTGNFEYAIEMYIQGLSVDPENVEAHQALREIALKRKASGGKDMGMFDKMKLQKPKDDKASMLYFEKLLAYSPGDTDRMLGVLQNAQKAGFYETVLWVGPILLRANADQKKSDFKVYIALADVYAAIDRFHLASEAANYALAMRPDDMELGQRMKNYAAEATMKEGNYGVAKSFRESVRDKDLQDKLLEDEKDVHTVDALERAIMEAEVAWKAAPEDQSKFTKFIDALRRPELDKFDDHAAALLEENYQKNHQFKWRQRIGEIRMAKLGRKERELRAEAERNKDTPEGPELLQQLKDFRLTKVKEELAEYNLVLEHYPTDSSALYQVALRTFQLGQFQESISSFQKVRSDPKYRTAASILLGQAFLLAGYTDEAVDTLKAVIDEYPNRGDERSMEMFYWYARALEAAGDKPAAIKAYSQVAQWNFSYRDVQTRIKALRDALK